MSDLARFLRPASGQSLIPCKTRNSSPVLLIPGPTTSNVDLIMILDKTKSTKVLHKTPANISEQLQIWAMVEEPGSKSV